MTGAPAPCVAGGGMWNPRPRDLRTPHRQSFAASTRRRCRSCVVICSTNGAQYRAIAHALVSWVSGRATGAVSST